MTIKPTEEYNQKHKELLELITWFENELKEYTELRAIVDDIKTNALRIGKLIEK